MPLTAALLSASGTNIYHPPSSTNSPADVLIWTVCAIVGVGIVAGAAIVARNREDRQRTEQSGRDATP